MSTSGSRLRLAARIAVGRLAPADRVEEKSVLPDPGTRVREPRPYLSHRVSSGRGATEQPNATGDDNAPLTPLFWLLTAATGLAAGLLGVLMILILHAAQQLTHDYAGAAPWRRVLVLMIGGLVTGVGWYVVRRALPGRRSDLDDALWAGDSRLSFSRSFLSSVLSEVAVGAGASLGREAAPKLLGGAAGSVLAGWGRLTPAQRRLLVACGGGAGMAAVYNVPLGGALLTAEVLYGSVTLPVVLPALLCSVVATVVSWVYQPIEPTYLRVPDFTVSASLAVLALLIGVVIGVVTVGYVRLVGAVSALRPSGWRMALAPAVLFSLVGVLAVHHPQLLGNGSSLAEPIFLGAGSAGLLLLLAVLKPVATMLCLGSGAAGGLFTPTLATGAAIGGFLGLVWVHLWPGAPVGACAIVGAAAMVSAGLQAPLAGMVLMLELTDTTTAIAAPMVIAVVVSTFISRYVDGYSIYSVRLPPP